MVTTKTVKVFTNVLGTDCDLNQQKRNYSNLDKLQVHTYCTSLVWVKKVPTLQSYPHLLILMLTFIGP